MAGVTEMGFLISDEPILGMEQDGVLKVAAVPGGTADSFESSYDYGWRKDLFPCLWYQC